MAANWSEIPEDVVYLLAERLGCLDDFVRFGAVCKTWRSVSILKRGEQVFSPLMMLAKVENDNLPTNDDDQGIRSFVIPYGEQQGEMRSFDLKLPKAQGRKCWGSPYGWVVTVGLDLNIHLLNPLTGAQLPLPPQPTLQQQSKVALSDGLTPLQTIHGFTQKFVLARNLSSSFQKEEFILMAIFGQYSEVAFTTTGNGSSTSSWKLVDNFYSCDDVIFFRGRIFMTDINGTFSVADINQTPSKSIQIASLPEKNDGGQRFYLVEIDGHLHMVVRYFDTFDSPGEDNFYYQTVSLIVFRFNFEENKWDELDDLGEYAVFVGNHTSFALSTIIYSDFASNSIYFADDHFTAYHRRFCDMGVFYYEDQIVEKYDFTNDGPFSKFSRPTFFMPAL